MGDEEFRRIDDVAAHSRLKGHSRTLGHDSGCPLETRWQGEAAELEGGG